MADLLGIPRALDSNGDPVSGAKAYIYETGTTTPVTTYTDSDLTTAHTNPIIADSDGRFEEAFAGTSTSLRCLMTTSADVTVRDYDPIPKSSSSKAGAGQVSSDPFTGNGATNVQEALENNYANSEAKAPQTRTLSAGTGLTGGGTLAADRSFNVDFATSGEHVTGTATEKSANPAGVKAQIADALVPDFTGTLLTTGHFGATSEFAHGLSAKPSRYVAYLVCTTAEHGYAVDDEIVFGTSNDSSIGRVVGANATNVFVVISTNFSALKKSDRTLANLTSTSWSLGVRAWV